MDLPGPVERACAVEGEISDELSGPFRRYFALGLNRQKLVNGARPRQVQVRGISNLRRVFSF